MTKFKKADLADLGRAYDGSWYFIAGCGGDLDEWVSGYEDELAKSDIGKPREWYKVEGWQINDYAGVYPPSPDAFPGGLTCLMFPLDGLNVGGLAMFKLRMGDRWFDDVIDNMGVMS